MLNATTKKSEVAERQAQNGGRGADHGRGPASAGSHTVSVLGGGIEVTGDVRGDGEIRIEGRVEGSVSTSGRVIVESSGEVEGDIQAEEVVANGKVHGNIAATGAVRLKKGCEIEADVSASTIELEEGGIVNGQLNMGRRGS